MKKIHALTRLYQGAVLAGCYIPIRFDAEIEISRGGYYGFKFEGYLAKVELFKGLKEGKINLEEEKKQIEINKNDFGRDTSVKEFKYLKMGHFKVNWERKGGRIMTYIWELNNIFAPTPSLVLQAG